MVAKNPMLCKFSVITNTSKQWFLSASACVCVWGGIGLYHLFEYPAIFVTQTCNIFQIFSYYCGAKN